MLNSFNIHVSTAGSSNECIQLLESASASLAFDIVLLDWKIQGIKGIEIARQIKNHPDLDKIPKVILITGVGGEKVLKDDDSTVLEGFLSKPVCASRLFDTILNCFGSGGSPSLFPGIPKEKIARQMQQLHGVGILLVEDNEINQQLAQELLMGAGLTVTVANNGKEALEKLKESEFGAVLMDVQMPVMDGYQAAREIRKNKAFDPLPIIAMTAHTLTGDREKCLKAGMNDHVSKPIAPDLLFTTLLRWIKPDQKMLSDNQPVIDQGVDLSQDIQIDDIPGISVKSGLARTLGNKRLYLELLKKFHLNHRQTEQDIRTALDKHDMETAIRLVHTIKGTAGNIGAKALFTVSEDLEMSIRQKKLTDLSKKLDLFASALETVLASLSELDPGVEPVRDALKEDNHFFKFKAPERGLSLLEKLEQLLKDDDTLSSQTFSSLKQAIPSDLEIEGMDKIERQIAEYEFDAALESLSKIKLKLKSLINGNSNEG